MIKQKTRKELENSKINWKALAIGFIWASVLLFILFAIVSEQKNNLKQQLSECQDKLLETRWSCPVLLEKGMYSLRDGGILISPSGIETKCSKVPVWIFKMKCSIPVDIHGSDILLYLKYLNYEQNFTDYNDYLTMKKVIDNDENCEVLE